MCTQNPVNTHMYAHDYHIAEDAANMHVYTANNRVPACLAWKDWHGEHARAVTSYELACISQNT